jgi:uncharacterized protein (TIGR02186 family)
MRVLVKISLFALPLVLSLSILVNVPLPARAQSLVADLSSHLIAVTTGFSGANLLLYGAVDAKGDVIVVVRGPDAVAEVRKKERVAGLWINQGRQEFKRVPTFYAISTSGDLDKILGNNVRARSEIGIDQIISRPGSVLAEGGPDVYWKALLRNKVRMGLYPKKPGKVRFLGRRLFSTNVKFPSNVPTGTFNVTVYLVRDGHVVNAQSTPLTVSKIGVGAKVFDFAHRYSALYGILAIFMALFAGWGAGAIFRRS